jgi:hypothetical protein
MKSVPCSAQALYGSRKGEYGARKGVKKLPAGEKACGVAFWSHQMPLESAERTLVLITCSQDNLVEFAVVCCNRNLCK